MSFSVRQHLAEGRQLLRWLFLQHKAAERASAMAAKRDPLLMLFPCDSGSVIGSRGDEAMVYAILSDFQSRCPGGRIAIVTTNPSFADTADGCRLQADFAPGLTICQTPGGLKNLFKLILSEQPTEVYALGADCMDGHYSPLTSVNLLGVCDLATRLGIPSVLTAFSWNEHPHAAVVRALRFASDRLPFLVRDPVSFARFAKDVSPARSAQAALVADVAFNLRPKVSSVVQSELDWMAAEKVRGQFVLGFNLHAMLVSAAELPDFIVRVACALNVFLAAHHNVSLVLIPHDYRDGGDLAVLSLLRAAVSSPNVRISAADQPLSAAELKALTMGLDALFSSRMHLAIAALGQGRPVAGFSYQGKFAGLFRHFDLPETLILRPCDGADLPRVLAELVKGARQLAASVSNRLPHVLELARRNLVSSDTRLRHSSVMSMNILYIAPTDPRETSYGGQQRTHAIWKGLCAIPDAKVSVFVPVPHKNMEKREPDAGIYRLCLERRHRPGWFLQRLLRCFIPYCDYSFAYNGQDLKILFPDIDAVVVRYVAVAAAFRVWRIAPLYLDADDIHTAEFDLETKVVGNSWMRRIKRAVIAHVQYGVYRRAVRIFIPAAEHLSILKGYPAVCLPNIPHPPLPDVAATPGERKRLLFVGHMASCTNYCALDRFVSQHWTFLKTAFPDLELHVAGSGLPPGYSERWQSHAGIIVRGYVEDLHAEFARSLALVTPMIMGSGSCIKVLESLRMGRPVVSTSQGLRGIRPEDRIRANGIFEYSDEGSLVESIRVLRSQDEAERQKMAAAAMQFVEDRFSQTAVSQILRKSIKG